jgi:hypothetical protein
MAASYPTSVKSFTTKSAGQTIQPAWFNDLQDEVAAIEGGLLNGTAPLNSSNSTVANLSVPGASTFTGNVTMSGTLTVATIVSTSITGGSVTSYVRAQAATTGQFSTSKTALVYDDRLVDLSSEYDSTTGTFTPKSSGYYQIDAHAAVLSADLNYLGVLVNSTIVAQSRHSQGAGNIWGTHHITTVLNLSSGATGAVTVQLWQDTTSTGRTDTGAGTYLNILKLF